MKRNRFLTGMMLAGIVLVGFSDAFSQNLVTNSSFNSGTSPWFMDNAAGHTASYSRSTDNPRSGTHCAKVTLTSFNPSATQALPFIYPQLAVKPGMPVMVKCWLRGAASGATVQVLLRNGVDTSMVYYSHRFKLRDSWQEFSFKASMPVTLDTTNVQFCVQLTEVGFFALDDVSVTNINLVSNPGFEQSSSPWTFSNAAGSTAGYQRTTTDPNTGTYNMELRLTSFAGASGNAELTYPGLQAKANMPVKLNFWARGASNGTRVNVFLRKTNSPFTTYFLKGITMPDTWQEYSLMTMMPPETASDVELCYQLTNTDTLLLDDVAVSDLNMITNAGFETGSTPWIYDNWAGNSGSATRITANPHSGTYALQMNLNVINGSPSLIYTYPSIPFKPKLPVQVRFWARGLSNSPAITVFLRQGNSPYTSYLRNEVGLTDDWQEYSFIAVMPPAPDTANIQLSFQLSNVGFFVIDDISITPMPEEDEGPVPVVNPIRNASFEAGTDGWSATFRQNEFSSPDLESGSHIPSPDNAALNIRTEAGVPNGKRYLRLVVNPDCRAFLTSAYFPARYGRPVTISCYIRSDSTRKFRMGYGAGKNKSTQYELAIKNVSTSWQKVTQKYTLPPAEGGVYSLFFRFEEPGGQFDIDAVTITEDEDPAAILYPRAIAIQPSACTPLAHLHHLNDTARFRLVVAADALSTNSAYAINVYDYREQNIYTSTVNIQTDTLGYADTAFVVPTNVQGGFRIEASRVDSTEILAEQLYSVLPVLPDPSLRPNSFFGGHADFTPYNLEIAKKGGFRWLRTWGPLTTTWIAAEPSPGVWKFPTTTIARADSMGFRLLGMLGTAPVFRADTTSLDPVNRWSHSYPPKDINQWKQYIVNVCNAYNAYINAWEVWNEPDGNYLMVKPGQSKPVVYYNLLNAARQVFDSMSVAAPLIGPAVANINDSIGWQVLNMGGNSKLDAFSFHLYNISSGGKSPDINYLTPVISNLQTYTNHQSQPMPLWHSEGGPYLSGGRSWLSTYKVPPSSSVTLPQAAAAMVRAALYLKVKGVKRYFDFTINASPTGRRIDVDQIAPYIDVNGIPTPGMAAHAAMVSITEDAGPLGFDTLTSNNSGVKVAHFQDSTHYIDVYWSNTPVLLKDIDSLHKNDLIKDIMGNLVDSNTAQVSEFPLYVIRNIDEIETCLAAKQKETAFKSTHVEQKSQISLSPNPAQLSAFLSHPSSAKGTFAYIVSMDGKRMRTFFVKPGTTSTPVDLSSLANGAYILVYDKRESIETIKFIKQ